MIKKRNKHESAQLKPPRVLKRAERADDDYLPGLEEFKPKPQVIRNDGLWPFVELIAGDVVGRAGYHFVRQVKNGRHDGCDVISDLVCYLPWEPDKKIIVSCKWLRGPGSWDGKVDNELNRLKSTVERRDDMRAWLILFGPGWEEKRKKRWVNGTKDLPKIRITDTDTFIAFSLSRRLWEQAP